MSHVERFVRFCESEFGTALMDREAAYLGQLLGSGDRVLDIREETVFETDEPKRAAILADSGKPLH